MSDANNTNVKRLAYRANEAAEALGISARRFRDIQHQLPHVCMGTLRLFPVAALEDWLSSTARTREGEIESAVEEALRSVREPRRKRPIRANGGLVRASKPDNVSEAS